MLKDPSKREALKAIDPSLPGLVRDAVFGAAQIKKEFPVGGLKEAIQYRDTVKPLGGPQAIQENHSALQEFNNLDSLYTEGKPEFIAQIAEGDPEAFEKMVPMAIEHFAKQSPEAYQHVMSRVLVATLDQAGFSRSLQNLYNSATTPEAKAEIEKLYNSVEGYRELAAKVPEKKINPEIQRLQEREQAFEQKQREAAERGVNTQSRTYRDSAIAKELKPFANWADLDDDRKNAIIREVRARTAPLANSDQAFKDARAKALARGDSEGALKLEKDFIDQHLPQIVPRVAKLFWSNPGAKKPAVQQQQTSGGKKADAGWRTVDAFDAMKVDKNRTNRDMIFAGKAIYKDGTKVQLRA